MNAKDILTRAVEYDVAGRRLEALKLYEDGIEELLQSSKRHADPNTRLHFRKRIEEYMGRAEKIKKEILRYSTLGEIVDRMHIMEGLTGYDYERIFGKYLNQDVHEIEIEEPYTKENYQLLNLVKFLELAIKKCFNLKFVKLSTGRDDRPGSEQQKALDSLQADLKNRLISFVVDFRTNMHDRQIILSNGFIIKIGRGLHIFKPTGSRYVIGFMDYHFRQCLETNVDIFKCKQNI